MKTKKFATKGIILLNALVTLAIVSSCTKNREVKFPYGGGENLLSISDFDGKEFDLITENEISQLATSQTDKIKENNSSVKNYNVVKYKTNAELMDDTAFVGKKNYTYKVKYELTTNFLKVYKVAAKEDLSINEITSAEKIDSKTMKVPLLGYPVTGYYKIEKSRNELNEETSTLAEKTLPTKSGATHFRINRQAKQVFKAVQKIDTFPANFFDGEWYYAETITATNYANQSNYGANISMDNLGNNATKVKLVKTETALNFINLNIDNDLKASLDQRSENQVSVITIPASWKEFKQASIGSDTALSEEENSELNWKSRSFVKLELSQAKSILLSNGQAEIQDLQISENYFSFVSIDKSSNSKFRHSFYKSSERNYKSKTYLTDDRNKFGFFYSKQNNLDSDKNYYEKDQEKMYFVNRFNPTRKVIEFHLSESSPEWSVDIAKKATEAWNEAFNKAGLQTEIKFNSERVQLGDLRYNVLNLISQPDDKFSWGGYGPTIKDPQTGEIISSTANVNLNDTINFIVEIMRRMADAQKGLLDKAYILGSPLPSFEAIRIEDGEIKNLKNMPLLQKALNSANQNRSAIKLPRFDKMAPKGFTYLKNSAPLLKKNRLQFAPESNLSISMSNIIADVNANCADVKKYIGNLTKDSVTSSSEDEYKLYLSCAQKISTDRVLSVLLHEMGHNFGLRHNFYGSVDVANFITKTARTSSVMEYTTSNEDRGGIGPYDVAAIMWGYNDQIETSTGNVKIDSAKSIQENMSEKNLSPKNYMYCSDEHVDVYAVDPMCARLDAGATPAEIVTNKIIDYNTSIALTSQKRSRAKLPGSKEIALSRFERYVLPIKKFYDFWRFQVATFVGPEQEYLENYDVQQYAQIIEKMKADPKFKTIVETYKPAADLAFNFLSEMAFLPNYYCLTDRELPEFLKNEQKKSTMKLFTLSAIKNEIFEKTGVNVNSCNTPEVIAYLKDKKATLLGQGGYHLNDHFNDLNILKTIDFSNTLNDYSVKLKPDMLGNLYDRAFAFGLLSNRFETSLYNQKLEFYPNFFDEPDKRSQLENRILSRFKSGVDINSLRILPNEKTGSFFSKNFVEEKDLLNFYFITFRDGYVIPGKIKENNERMDLFQINFAYNQDQIQSLREAGIKTATTQIMGQTYYATEKNKIAYIMLALTSSINSVKNMKLPNDEVLSIIKKTISDALPTKESIQTITVANYLAAMEEIRKLGTLFYKNKTSEVDTAFAQRLSQKYFRIEQLLEMLLANNKIKSDDIDAIKKFSERKFIEVSAEIESMIQESNKKSEDPEDKIESLNTDDLLAENLDANIKVISENSLKIYEIFRVDEKEFEAQLDVLTNALLSGRM